MRIARYAAVIRLTGIKNKYDRIGDTSKAETVQECIEAIREIPEAMPEIAIVNMTRKERRNDTRELRDNRAHRECQV